MGHPIRLELTREGLLIYLAYHYITRDALLSIRSIQSSSIMSSHFHLMPLRQHPWDPSCLQLAHPQDFSKKYSALVLAFFVSPTAFETTIINKIENYHRTKNTMTEPLGIN